MKTLVTKTRSLRINTAAEANFSRGKVADASFPRFLRSIVTGTVLVICASAALPAHAVEVSIDTLGGQEVVGDLDKIEKGEAHLTSSTTVPLSEIRRIQFPGAAGRPKGAETLFLSCGSIASGEMIKLTEDETISVDLAAGISTQFAIDAVRGVRLLPERKNSLFERQLAGPGDPEQDRVYVPQGSELRELTGIIETLGPDQITIDRDGALVELPRSKVYGVLFANAVEPELESLNANIVTKDGSTLRGSITGLDGGSLAIKMVSSTEVNLPVRNVDSIRLQPPNLVYASDLEPSAVVIQPILAPSRNWQRDLSVTGNALQVKSRIFEKGIGMAGGTQLTFKNPGTFATFSAVVGIDRERGDRGDCVAVVSGNGTELARHRLKGNAPEIAINVDVSSVAEIILTVEPGEDYDLSDHVNWCDAAFIKK